jgi:hypothetical protein
MGRRALFGFAAFAVTIAFFPAASASAPAVLYAGADREDITPFTYIPGVTHLMPGSSAAASNPDGLPGGDPDLHTAHELEWRLATFDGQVTATGVWGEPFTDAPGGRAGQFDDRLGDSSRGADAFTDDPANAAIDPDSAAKWDGIYLAGEGTDRVATGAIDKLWVRVAVFANFAPGADVTENEDGESLAIASIDTYGYFSDWTPRILDLARQFWPLGGGGGGEFWLDRLIVSATHNHNGPDIHVGFWGPNVSTDGTYPKYERYVERKIAIALVHAMVRARPATIRAGAIGPAKTFRTRSGRTESLAGMQARHSCRTPWFFDGELRAVALSDAEGRPILSMINWGSDNGSLAAANTLLSQDLAGSAREELERQLGGGVAIWVPGAHGFVDAVGSSCASRWRRASFDGSRYSTPTGRVLFGPARTAAMGRVAGDAAYAALQGGTENLNPVLGRVSGRVVYFRVANAAIASAAAGGVIDKPEYAMGASAGPAAFDALVAAGAPADDAPDVPGPGLAYRTVLYTFQIGPASFVTAPGALSPEGYQGVRTFNRSMPGAYAFRPFGDYLACSSRAAEKNGRPLEPAIRDRQAAHFPGAGVHLLLGDTPDMLGPIVPGYDYEMFGVPGAGAGLPVTTEGDRGFLGAAPDACRTIPIAPPLSGGTGERFTEHTEELATISSMFAPSYACAIDGLLVADAASAESLRADTACREAAMWETAGLRDPGLQP